MKAQKGYTLTEMLVVLLLLSLITTITPVAVQKLLPSIAVQSAAQTLNADLEVLRTRSLMTGNQGHLHIENDGENYSLIIENETVKRRSLANSVRIQLPKNLKLEDGNAPILAKADGRLQGPTLRLVRGNTQKNIVINPVFGTAEIGR